MNPKPSLRKKITESSPTLLALLPQQTNRWSYLKVKMLYLLKSGKAHTLQRVAVLLELHEQTPLRWFQTYEEGGLQTLLTSPKPQLSDIPTWTAERLLAELQKAAFLPTSGIVQVWLRTFGIKVSNDTASLLLSALKPRLQLLPSQAKALVAQGAPRSLSEALLLASDVYQPYEQWKQQHQLSNEAEALSQIISEYFECNQADSVDASETLQEPSAAVLALVDAARQQDVPALLHQDGLAQRLAVNSSLLSRNRSKPTFTRWSQQHDPDGLGWQWLPSLRKYQSLT